MVKCEYKYSGTLKGLCTNYILFPCGVACVVCILVCALIGSRKSGLRPSSRKPRPFSAHKSGVAEKWLGDIMFSLVSVVGQHFYRDYSVYRRWKQVSYKFCINLVLLGRTDFFLHLRRTFIIVSRVQKSLVISHIGWNSDAAFHCDLSPNLFMTWKILRSFIKYNN